MADHENYQQVVLSPAERRQVHHPTPEEKDDLDRLYDDARLAEAMRALQALEASMKTGGEK